MHLVEKIGICGQNYGFSGLILKDSQYLCEIYSEMNVILVGIGVLDMHDSIN